MAVNNTNFQANNHLPHSIRAAGYKRISDENDDGTTLVTQEEKITEYFRIRGYMHKQEHMYQDKRTGVIYRERSGIQAMLAAARRKEFDVLVVYDLDRFSRNPVHQAILMELLTEQGVRVECVLRELDQSPEGKLVQYIMGYAAQLEHERIGERTERGRQDRIKNKKWLPGGAPRPLYGYRWDNPGLGMKTAYVINPEEAVVVHRIFDMMLQHIPIRAIVRQLTQENIPTPQGKSSWATSTIQAILKNPFYTGRAFANRYKAVHEPGKKPRVEPRPQEEWISLPDGTVPAIIDQETFEKAQQALETNKQRAARNNRYPKEQLLRGGLVLCGYCGRKMAVARRQGRKSGRADYRCMSLNYPGVIEKCSGGFYETHILDEIAWQCAMEVIRNPWLVEQAVKAQKPKEQAIKDLHIIEDNLAKINRKIRNLTALLGKDGQNLDMDEDILEGIMGQLKALSDQKKSWEEQRKSSVEAQEQHEKEKKEWEKFLQWCENQRTQFDDPTHEITYEDKRNALERLRIRAVVWRSDHAPRHEIVMLVPDFVSTISSRFACKRADT